MRKNRTDPVKVVLGIAVGVLMLTATFFAVQYLDTIRHFNEIMPSTEEITLQNENTALLSSLEEAELRIYNLQSEIDRLNGEIELYAEITGEDVNFVEEMNTRLQYLRNELLQSETERQSLITQIEALQATSGQDFSEKTKLITELMTLLMKKAPMHKIEPETSEISTDEDAETLPLEEVYPTIALYYKDLTTGYSVAYNEDEILYSASLIKLPYVYAVIREIAAFEDKKLNFSEDGQPLYDEEGVPLFEGEHPNIDTDGSIIYQDAEKKYDLTNEWVYDPETMFKEGSGIIQYEQAGFTLTYKQLFEYTILHSDNIAFEQLRQIYGMDSFYNLVWRLSIKGTQYGFMQLTASDCAAVLEDVYSYFQTEEKYALFLQDILTRSSHTVMIQMAVAPVACAHKYGWDEESYHDMGIVLDDHPYIIVIMTNLDEGGEEVNSYIRSIVRKCREIQNSTYKTES